MTSSLENYISPLSFPMGRLLILEVLILLYSFPVGQILFWGVLPFFNGLPFTYGIFFSSKKGCPGGKYLPQLPKHQHGKLFLINT
jgi:hypothetical protein